MIFLLDVTNNAVVSGLILNQVAEKRPSAAFLLPTGRSFVVAAYREVRLTGKSAGCPAFLPVGRGGEESRTSNRIYISRKPRPVSGELHSSGFQGVPRTGFRRAQLASACLREAASAKAGSFLSNLRKMTFSAALRFLLYFCDLVRARLRVET